MTRVTKLLIANRGEIASRVIRTARALDIATVAVFSEPDAGAPFVREADEAVALPGRTAAETYLRGDAVIEAALATGARAIHPGYGFLSENADFAEACATAGLTFVGPPPAAIRAMGSKTAAKALMAEAGVPVLPGITIDDDLPADLAARVATEVGFPALVKAAFGGGGRGMRVVTDPGGLVDAVASARREAASAFGDGTVFVERLVRRPRHIEVQIFADSHGHVVHLFERECSIQRRYQKIIEEAPSPRRRRSAPRRAGRRRSGGGQGDRLRRRGHGRVHPRRRRRVLLPGGQHPAAGGAPRHRAGHRSRPRRAATRRRRGRGPAAGRAASRHQRPCRRGSSIC